MFEYFYDVYYMIYQFVTVDQYKDYYFCRLFLMFSNEHDSFLHLFFFNKTSMSMGNNQIAIQ